MRHAFEALLKNKWNFLAAWWPCWGLAAEQVYLRCRELGGSSSFQDSKLKCAGRRPKQAQDDSARQCLSEWDHREHCFGNCNKCHRFGALVCVFYENPAATNLRSKKKKKVLYDSNFYNKCKLKKMCHPLEASLNTIASRCAAIAVISKSNVLNPQTALSGHSLAPHRNKHAAQAWKPNVHDSPFAKTKQYKKTPPAKSCEFQIIECKTNTM